MILAELVAWSKLLRENFVTVMLAVMFAGIFGVVVYMTYHPTDANAVGWVHEAAGDVLSCLFGLLTGKSMSSGKGTGEPSATTTTTTIVRAEGPVLGPEVER